MQFTTDWTADEIAYLTKAWLDGLSGATIGRCLGRTKNMVIGKAHRLGLSERRSPIKRRGDQPLPPPPCPANTLPPLASLETDVAAEAPPPPPRRSRKPPSMALAPLTPVALAPLAPPKVVAEVVKAPSVPKPVIVPDPPKVVASQRQYGRVIECCWLTEKVGARGYDACSSPSLPGKPYCAAHAAIAYLKRRNRADDDVTENQSAA